MPDYDARQRPWYKVAMAAFRDQKPCPRRSRSVEPGGVDRGVPLFTTKAPSISAAVAARDPSGEILIVTYDLPLDRGREVSPPPCDSSPRGLMFVLTDEGAARAASR